MVVATLLRDGSVPIPSEVRTQLGLSAGDVVEQGRMVVSAARNPKLDPATARASAVAFVAQFAGILPPNLSDEDIDRAVLKSVAESWRASEQNTHDIPLKK